RPLRQVELFFRVLLQTVQRLTERSAVLGRSGRQRLQLNGNDAALAGEIPISRRTQIGGVLDRGNIALDTPLQLGDVHAIQAVFTTGGQEFKRSGEVSPGL